MKTGDELKEFINPVESLGFKVFACLDYKPCDYCKLPCSKEGFCMCDQFFSRNREKVDEIEQEFDVYFSK